MQDIEEFFDVNGTSCKKSETWVARSRQYESGVKYYVIAHRQTRRLFNPNSDDISDTSQKRGRQPLLKEEEVRVECFSAYVDYLQTKNDLKYNQANMYRR